MNVRLRVSGGAIKTTEVKDIDVIYNNVNIRWMRFDLNRTTITMSKPFKIEIENGDMDDKERQLTINEAD